ncbi:MAG: YlbF family regulator [Longimicrobiales bacterium]
MQHLLDMATDLGRGLARTDEYHSLKRAITSADDDRDIAESKTELEGLEARIEEALRAGGEPDDELKTQYEDAVGRLQTNTTYQVLVAAQANFEKIVFKVNQTIQGGIDKGSESRIVLP